MSVQQPSGDDPTEYVAPEDAPTIIPPPSDVLSRDAPTIVSAPDDAIVAIAPGDAPTVASTPGEIPTVIHAGAGSGALGLTPGAVLGDRYRIVSLIGRGGMGEVYRADDLKLGQTVALKFLSGGGDTRHMYEEVRAGRQVSHPNVCRLHDIAEVGGRLFITMEFVDGEDLASLLRRVGRLPAEKAIAVSRDICAGIAAAHDRGLIHRDLKPANVMIDGRGRARVTDFGLAVAEGHKAEFAGTPAYMAPEQLEGKTVTQKSDVYALGLVLYEMYTGRRPYDAKTTLDMVVQQHRAAFTRASGVAEVDEVIAECLDPDPERRPGVGELLARLGGSDTLATAVAAGETPSPEMVAAAAKVGDLTPAVAWSALAVVLAGLAAAALTSDRRMVYRATDIKAPEVLQDRARQVLADAGWTEPRGDSALVVDRPTAAPRLAGLYRESKAPLVPRNATGAVSLDDPPLLAGMAAVRLHSSGSLAELTLPPPRSAGTPSSSAYDWRRVIAHTGVNPETLRRTTPEWSAPVDSDRKHAWLTPDGVRVEAAEYRGRPTWLAVMGPGQTHGHSQPARGATETIVFTTIMVSLIAIPIASIVLARRNLRRRQGDRAGALKIGTFFFIATLVGMIAHAHHPGTFASEWTILSWHVTQAAFWALLAALMYLALEPIVRKRWPQILISWTRLLSGRFTDPMVGRDVLVGVAGATLIGAIWHATLFLSPPDRGPHVAMGLAREIVFLISYSAAEAVLRGLGTVILLVLLRAVIPNDHVVSALTILGLGLMTLGQAAGPMWVHAVYAAIAVLASIVLIKHFGMLAAMSYSFFLLLYDRIPFALEADAWYFGRSMASVLLVAAIALWAFRVSLGTKRWLPQIAVD